MVSRDSSAFARPISALFGAGAPGWLVRDVPPSTTLDFAEGLISSPIGRFARIPATHNWARIA